jgi:hypothetical protein
VHHVTEIVALATIEQTLFAPPVGTPVKLINLPSCETLPTLTNPSQWSTESPLRQTKGRRDGTDRRLGHNASSQLLG